MKHAFRTDMYDVHEVEGEHGRVTLEARWNGRGEPAISVVQSGDGCITVAVKLGFLYAGEIVVLRDMLNACIDRRAARHAAYLAEKADKHVHDGIQVDLSVTETVAALHEGELRFYEKRAEAGWGGHLHRYLQLQYRGEWYDVCRTDLHDDVATTNHLFEDDTRTAREIADGYAKECAFGARLRRDGSGPSFRIIDALSDG